MFFFFFFFSSRRRHTRFDCDWSSDVCSSDLRRLFPAHRSTGHRRGLPARLHRAGRRAVPIGVLILATLRRVAPAQTLPRGESGPEAGDGSVAQTCSSVLPRRNPHRFRRGFLFSKSEYWDQLPSLSSESKREDATARFCAGAFLMGFLAGYPVLPTQRSILSLPSHHGPCGQTTT